MDRLVSFDKQLQIKLSIIRLFISMWSFDKDCLSVLIEEIKKVFKIIFHAFILLHSNRYSFYSLQSTNLGIHGWLRTK